ncbi:MAG: DUF2141 domain-containing protein [Sphingopyxis sp.]
MKMTLLAAAALATLSAPAMAGDLTVTLAGVEVGSAPIYVSLQREGDFMQSRGSYGTIVRSAASGRVTVTLADVEPGDYALNVWHDTNNDHVFSMGEHGPTDGWAMSFAGDIAALRGPPTFAQARFVVGVEAQAMTVQMQYPQAR